MTPPTLQKEPTPETFALVPGHGWLIVDRVGPGEIDDYGTKPWFIGTGCGFDINRFIVYEQNEQDALETAEEHWSDRIGRNSEVRILTVAERVAVGAPQGGSDALLADGERIHYS